jgi:Kef-type K+ transport system membrane component KefB/Trk K+ transport system NAD-binding subunit
MEMFNELAIIVFIATGVSVLMRLLKQPLIVGYILAGILVGPSVFNALHSTEFIDILSKMGITILLFVIGLHMSPKVIKEVGKVSLLTGGGQFIFTAIVGYLIAIGLGFSHIAALYISIGLTFSSTIIVLKLLSDKGDLNKLYGKITIGFLLIQDIIAAVILVLIPVLAGDQGGSGFWMFVGMLGKALALSAAVYLVAKFFLPKFVKFAAASQELLFLFSISWGLALAAVFHMLGFSAEIGALVAGVTLSVTPYAYQIGSRLKPLRDFFIVLFFVLTGSHIDLGSMTQILVPAIVLSLYVLLGNPIIMVILMRFLGYQRKTAYLSGLTVSQISEFSLILAAVGFSMGHLSQNEFSLITLIGLITITGSTYFMLYAEKMYPHVEKSLKKLDFLKSIEEYVHKDEVHDVLLFGYDRVGHDFVNLFKKLGKDYLVIDFNPHLIREMQQKIIPCRYGDAEDIEFLQELHLKEIKMCVSTIPDFKISSLLLRNIRKENHHAIIILLSHDIDEAIDLYKQGASYVMLPHYLSAKHTVHMIDKLGFDKKEFDEERKKHLEYIQEKEMYV